MNRFTMVVNMAALLASTGAQAHQYSQQIASWTTRFHSAEKTICDVQCSLAGLDHLVTYHPSIQPATPTRARREVF